MARRRNSNRRRRRGSFGFLYKLLSMLVICGAIIAALTLFFRVDTIVVTGTEQYTEDEVIAATGVDHGDNLILLNKYDVQNRIREQLPYIEWLRINRRYPATLLVEVVRECRQPMAVVQDGSAWLVSTTGKIVDQKTAAEAADYGKIDGCELLAPSVGTPMALATEYSGQAESLVDLLTALETAGVLDKVDAIHLDDLSVLVMDYDGRFRVELPYHADYDYKLQYLLAAVGNEDIATTDRHYTVRMTRDDGKVSFIPSA